MLPILRASRWLATPAIAALTLSAPVYHPEPQAPRHKISSFTYNYTGPYRYPVPMFEATILRSGSATYNGKQGVPRIGKYSAKYEGGDFWKLDMVLEKLGFWEMPAKEGWSPHGHNGFITITVASDLGTKTLNINLANERSESWAIRTLLQEMIESLTAFKKMK